MILKELIQILKAKCESEEAGDFTVMIWNAIGGLYELEERSIVIDKAQKQLQIEID